MLITLKRTKGDIRIRRGYGIAFFLLLFGYFVTFYANRQLLNQSAKVEHSYKVITNLEIMLSKLKDAETGIRGYIITKNEDFLSTYYGSTASADSLYQVINQLTADNQEQQDSLISLKSKIDKRISLFPATINIFNKNNTEISDSLINIMSGGKVQMDEIRFIVSNLQIAENKLLVLRNTKLDKTFSSVKVITIISVLLALLLILFGFITYQEENKARKKGVSEIDDYQQQLKKQIDELSKANTELMQLRSHEKFAVTGRIARTIAHEVRNPLTNINLAADQLKTEIFPDDENASSLFDMITRNSNRINQLIADLLNSTKFSELTYTKISVNDLLDETLKDATDRISLTHVQIIKNYTSSICDVSVDKERLKVAFLNIIINALEAMGNKKDSVLTINTKVEGDLRLIKISDNGYGMDEEALSRVFEPYFTSKPKGNGLGLTNTQKVILNHKGEIYAESVKGKGTSFIITLHCAPEYIQEKG